MNRWTMVLAFVGIFVLGTTGAVLAGDGCQGTKAAKGDGCGAAKAAVAKSEGCGSMTACATKGLPAMAYRVGDKTVSCPKEAKALADANGGSINYVVGEKCFADQAEAMAALADATDVYLVAYVKVSPAEGCSGGKVCPSSGKAVAGTDAAGFRVAGHTYDCPTKAERASKVAAEAMAKVAMKYRVGDKEFCCGETAASVAKECNGKILYVVGTESTPCNVTARLMAARMKVEAAERALADAGLGGTETTL